MFAITPGGTGPEWLDAIDLSDIVAGQPIYDMAVYSDGVTVDGFFATKLGAFRMPQSVLDGQQRSIQRSKKCSKRPTSSK